MLSVITAPERSAEGLSGLLSDLVPGAVSGLIRDVLVLEPEQPDPDLAALCEEAGACAVPGGLAVAVRQARSDLILRASPALRLDAFALDRLGRDLVALGTEGVVRGLALTGPAVLGFWSPAPPLGLVRSRAHLLGLPPGSGVAAALRRASRGALRLRIAG
jgi:hypothetical protein